MRGWLAVLALTLAAAPAQARDIYDCAFRQQAANGNWLPGLVVLDHDPQSDVATVYDPFIKQIKGHPIAATVETRNAHRLTVIWKLDGLRDTSGTNVTFAYRLTVRPDLGAKISGKALGFDNGLVETTGQCKVQRK